MKGLRTTISLIAAALYFNVSVFADPATVVDQARTWRVAHEVEILSEFVELLAIPNLATDAPNIRRNATTIRAMCEKRGLTTTLLELEGAPPVVVADLSVPEAKRTIAFYAHYDGQPVETSPARSGRSGDRLARSEITRSGIAPLRALCGRRQSTDHGDARSPRRSANCGIEAVNQSALCF